MPQLRIHIHRALKIAILSLLLPVAFSGSEPSGAANASVLRKQNEDPNGTLAEIRDKQRVALIVLRSSVVDASGTDDRILAEALAAEPREARRYRYAFGLLARKLNQYSRKYRSLRPVYEIAHADFIIYFRLVEYRRLLNGYYPYGELFVILNEQPDERRPAKLLWRSKKVMYAEDTVKDFIKELRQVRGER